MTSRDTGRSNTEYLIRVMLKYDHEIWRTIAIRGDRTLHDLHSAIFLAFDRYDDGHLYSFYFPRAPRARGTKLAARVREYTSPCIFEQPGPDPDDDRLD